MQKQNDKYETSNVGYRPCKQFQNYKINLEKGAIINKTNMFVGKTKVKGKRSVLHIGKQHYFLDEVIFKERYPAIKLTEYEIMHKNGKITDNRISNLKKQKRIAKTKKLILETNLTTNKQIIYKTFSAPAKKRLINPGIIKMNCDLAITKAISKKNNKIYSYQYITEDEFKELEKEGVKLYKPKN